MIQVEIEEKVDRPIDVVFDQLVDIDGYPAWMPDGGFFVDCRVSSEGPVEEGTRYIDRTRLGAVSGEVATLERPERVVFHYTARLFGMKAMEGWPGYTLEPDGDAGTRLLHEAEARLYGPFKLLAPLIQILAERERQRTVDALKASLEDA